MRLRNDPKRWGVPLSALLGALYAQLNLGLGAAVIHFHSSVARNGCNGRCRKILLLGKRDKLIHVVRGYDNRHSLLDMIYREKPAEGDVVVLLGGETGRDGCGGATGSSKAHDKKSVQTCGAEVQKGNALTERKIQRLFPLSDCRRKKSPPPPFGL